MRRASEHEVKQLIAAHEDLDAPEQDPEREEVRKAQLTSAMTLLYPWPDSRQH